MISAKKLQIFACYHPSTEKMWNWKSYIVKVLGFMLIFGKRAFSHQTKHFLGVEMCLSRKTAPEKCPSLSLESIWSRQEAPEKGRDLKIQVIFTSWQEKKLSAWVLEAWDQHQKMPVNGGILIYVPHLGSSTSPWWATRCTTTMTSWGTSTGHTLKWFFATFLSFIWSLIMF